MNRSVASDAVIESFCVWLKQQTWVVQQDVIFFAERLHNYSADSPKYKNTACVVADCEDELLRLQAKTVIFLQQKPPLSKIGSEKPEREGEQREKLIEVIARLIPPTLVFHLALQRNERKAKRLGLGSIPVENNTEAKLLIARFGQNKPSKKLKITTRVTSADAAVLLNMSRATFFRMVKNKRFQESLGFAATNTRNGRYSLERVLDAAIKANIDAEITAQRSNG